MCIRAITISADSRWRQENKQWKRKRERERGRESESKGTDIMTRSLRERFYMCAFVCVEVCL